MTNKAKRSHGKLKRQLKSGEGSFAMVFSGMANILCLQLNKVQVNFERSLGTNKKAHHEMSFKELKGNILHFALDMIKNEKD